MSKEVKLEMPTIKVASEPWVMEKLMDTERRIEKAFHEQTQYLAQRQDNQLEKLDSTMRMSNEKLDSTVRWVVGLMITMIITLVAAIFIQPHI